jgi:hypothetical protein
VIPTTATNISSTTGDYNGGPCLSPTYVATVPFDPSASGAHWTSTTDYNTGYTVARDATTGRITVNAPAAEVSEVISITR